MAEMHEREIPLSVAGRNYCVEDNSEAQISCLLAFDETYSSIYNKSPHQNKRKGPTGTILR